MMNYAQSGPVLACALLLAACGDDGRETSTGATGNPSGGPTTAATGSSGDGTATESPTGSATGGDASTAAATGGASTSSATTGAVGCGACDQPNQQCIADQCVTSCQGQDPDPCGPGMVCDVISGQCKDTAADCTLAGPIVTCGASHCGPGSACDGQGGCVPIAPCDAVVCTADQQCWGSLCACERKVDCTDPAVDLLNGPFAADISALDFADDCTAWSVTVSGGQEFVRSLASDGMLTTYGAIGDYDLGEVRVLRHLTIPQLTVVPPLAAKPVPFAPVEGYGEVALTYICCPNCGDCANNPNARGVAHLVETDPMMPLPIVIFAEATQGTGPFGEMHLDGGPQGLTWGKDRVLYVGNAQANGDYSSADLMTGTVTKLHTFDTRVSASAPISPAHNLVAVLGGELYRFNVATKEVEFVVDLMSDVTSLTHDAFDGHVYASLASLEVVRVHPFTGAVEPFQTMPAKGRVAASPGGKLWYTPVKYLNPGSLSAWDLPAKF